MLKKYVKPEAEMKSFVAIEKIASNFNDWTNRRGAGLGLGSGAGGFTTSYNMSSLMQG